MPCSTFLIAFLVVLMISSIGAVTPFFSANLVPVDGTKLTWSGVAQQMNYFFFDVMPGNGGSTFPHEVNVTISSKNAMTAFSAVMQRGAWPAVTACPTNYVTDMFANPYQCNDTQGAVTGKSVLSIGWPVSDRYYVIVQSTATDTFTLAVTMSYCPPNFIGHNCTYQLIQLNTLQTAQPINVTAAIGQTYVYSFVVPSSGGGPAGMKIDMSTFPINCDPADNSSLWFRYGSVGYHSSSTGRLEVSVALNCSAFGDSVIMFPETGMWFLTVYGGGEGITSGSIVINIAPCSENSTGMRCTSATEVPLCQYPPEPEFCAVHLIPIISPTNFTAVPFLDPDATDGSGFAAYYFVDMKTNSYDIKVTVIAAQPSQNFTIVGRSGNVPSYFPAADPPLALSDGYQYYAYPNGSGIAELRVRYASANSLWYFGVWTDPNNTDITSTFNVYIDWHDCWQNCNKHGSCDTQSSLCKCKSGWAGDSCELKSRASRAWLLVSSLVSAYRLL